MNSTNLLNLRNFKVDIAADGLTWLGIDCPGTSVNRLSSEVLAELMTALDHFERQPPAALIIHSLKPSGFIAGADIAEFNELEHTDTVHKLIAQGWNAFQRLAAARYPTLALVRGHCLGGGLELALACRYRLAVDHPDTSFALPEVMLGIFPAWGGMKRLPALIGAPAALDMMLSGRAIDARKAQKLGLVDARVPLRLERQAAAQHVRSGKPAARARGLGRLLNFQPLRPLVMRQTAKKLNERDPYQHYLAPRAILEIWGRHQGNAMSAPALVKEISQSDTARNLIRVFHLQEQLKAFGKPSEAAGEVHHVHVVGAGAMGGDIAAWCALKGFKVTLQDQDRERIADAQSRAHALYARRLKEGRLHQAAQDRLIPDPLGHGVSHADLIIEAITESLEAKQALYARIEPRMKAEAVLATNTSSLSLAALGAQLRDASRLVGIHFFNPVARMPLVEVVRTDALAADALATALAFVGRLGKLPLPVKDTPGFLVNAVLAPYMLEAMRCVDEGLSSETIDEAMKIFGMPMGPLELADTVGLDIAHAAGQQLAGAQAIPHCLENHLSRKELGRKTSRGFYAWKDGKPIKKEPGTPPADLALRLVSPLVEKTHEQVARGIIASNDLADAGVIFGTGFAPFSGGPLYWEQHRAPEVTPI
ncbi:MAG: enoyl-CoA hydratase [Alcaligenaceae bacterium]|nr:enoyl-CoA hydratase [Alcaligenaceae bacterium]